MLRISIHEEQATWNMKLEGVLVGEGVAEAEQAWMSAPQTKPRIVDISGVTRIGDDGKQLLAAMRKTGAGFRAKGVATKALISELCGIALAGLLMLAVALLAEPAFAQDAPVTLTLPQAIKLALSQSPSAQIANIEAALAQEGSALARSALIPQAGLAFNQSIQRFNIESVIGQRIPGVAQHVGPFQVLNPGVQLTTPVFDLALWKQYGATKDRARAAAASTEGAHEEIALLVVSQYMGTMRATAKLQAATARRDLSLRLDAQAADLLRDGVATEVDMLRAKVRLKQDEQDLIQAQTAETISFYSLARLLGLPPAQPITLSDDALSDAPKVDPDIAPESALRQRPEIAAATAGIEAANKMRQAARASNLPTLKFSGVWGLQASHFDGMIPAYTYQLNLSVPLFTGGALSAARKRAELDEAKARQQRDDLRNGVTEQILIAEAQVRSAHSQIDVANTAISLAQRELTLATDRFQEGVADNIEITAAQASLAEVTDRRIEALFAFNIAQAQLSRAAGLVRATYEGRKK
jgi:outer membrane protein TolC